MIMDRGSSGSCGVVPSGDQDLETGIGKSCKHIAKSKTVAQVYFLISHHTQHDSLSLICFWISIEDKRRDTLSYASVFMICLALDMNSLGWTSVFMNCLAIIEIPRSEDNNE